MTPARGKFITVEGQDGAGKSTNLEVIAEYLHAQDITLVQTREPGGTVFGERIRELLLDSTDKDFGDLTELLLVFAARAQHLEEVIEPALAAGQWVLCDRFTDATYAYQGSGRGIAWSAIQRLEHLVQQGRKPDLTLLLDLPVEVGQQRADDRSAADRFELQKLEFKQHVRDGYLKIADAEPERIKIIDAGQTKDQVADAIRRCLSEYVDGK